MYVGLIGGSGLYEIDGLTVEKEVSLSTPFGDPSASYTLGILGDRKIAFLPRHGRSHGIAPHKVNYRANLWGFKSLGVERIISVSAVGGLNTAMPPGTLVLLDQIIDMTGGARLSTFYETDRVVHIDFTEPYCRDLRDTTKKAAGKIGLPIKERGTYVCVNGPRLETAAEIRFFSLIGGDVVGMTAMPEVSLARELEMCILGLSLVTNYAAGISEKKLTTTEVVRTVRQSEQTLHLLLGEVVSTMAFGRTCPCKDALKDAGL